ncbi:MAG: J domain-containing protein [Microthrixaceae bacterium]
MSEERDHYQVLGIDPSASVEEVRAAHRRLVRMLHPDRHVGATQAERALADRRMREINDAWNTLRDEGRRSSYDAQRKTRLQHEQASAGGTGTGSQRRRPTNRDGRRPQPTRQRTGNPGAGNSSAKAGRATSTAGRGAYWHPKGGDGGGTGARADSDDDDGLVVGAWTAQLLRKGPIIVIIAVVLGLFIVTAYAGGRGETKPVQPPPLEGCARVYDGSNAIIVPCDVPNDGRIVAQVRAALDCPDRAPRYVSVDTRFFCIAENQND